MIKRFINWLFPPKSKTAEIERQPVFVEQYAPRTCPECGGRVDPIFAPDGDTLIRWQCTDCPKSWDIWEGAMKDELFEQIKTKGINRKLYSNPDPSVPLNIINKMKDNDKHGLKDKE